MKDRIACITKQRAAEILDSISEGNKYSPKGLFLHREGGHYIGIDNSNGEAWTEQFTTLGDCIDWLRGNADMDDIWTREAERVRDKIFCPSCHKGSTFYQWNCADGNDIELDLRHELENDDEDAELWIHCPHCGAQVAVHMIIEENQDRIGWMEWNEQELDTVEEDIVAELEFSGYKPDPVTGVLDAENAPESPFEKMLGERSREVGHLTRFLDSLPAEYSFLRRVLDGLDIYIRDGIDQDEPYNIVQTIKHQQEALHSLRNEKHELEGSCTRLAKQITTLQSELKTQKDVYFSSEGALRDAKKNISKRDQEIATLTNLRATDKIHIANLADTVDTLEEKIGTLSCLNDDLEAGIRKATLEAASAKSKFTLLREAILNISDENEQQ